MVLRLRLFSLISGEDRAAREKAKAEEEARKAAEEANAMMTGDQQESSEDLPEEEATEEIASEEDVSEEDTPKDPENQ